MIHKIFSPKTDFTLVILGRPGLILVMSLAAARGDAMGQHQEGSQHSLKLGKVNSESSEQGVDFSSDTEGTVVPTGKGDMGFGDS